MINVLIIANELRYTCGVTNHILHLTKGLAESGEVKLFIICGGGNGIERFKDIKADILTDKRFFHKGRNFKNYLSAITFLAKYIRKNKINIIHSHTHYAANIAAKAAKISKAATLQTNHGVLQTKGRLKHFNAGKYIAINEHIENYLTEKKIAEAEQIEFIRCGIPVDIKSAFKNNEKIKVICASRFSYEKGIDIYIKAVSRLDNSIKEKAELLIAGEGELEKSLVELSKTAKAGINFLGNIKNIYPLLRETHILVYPSRSKSEGFPAIITEAGACSNLVISSRFNGAENILINNENSLLFDVEDTNLLAELLTKAIAGYCDYENLSITLYNMIKQQFEVNTMIEKHLQLYKKLAAN